MLVPISWLKNYVPVNDLPEDLAHKLTMAGIEIGDVATIGADWEPDSLVVGHVLTVPSSSKIAIGEELATFNITRETMFPGLEEAAKAVTDRYRRP